MPIIEEGLAAMMSTSPLGEQGSTSVNINQILELLQQGLSPEELVAMGVSMELIEQAMAMIQNQGSTMNANQGLGEAYVDGLK